MNSRAVFAPALISAFVFSMTSSAIFGEEPSTQKDIQDLSPQPASAPRITIDRGLAFLSSDAVKWRAERGCATCHHGTMTVWALNEARAQGYSVDAERLADVTQWTKDQFIPRIVKPRDSRPGWNLVSIPGIYLGMMSRNLPV